MLKISQNNDNRGRHLEFYFHTGIGNWFQCLQVYPSPNLSSGSGSGSEFRIPAFPYALFHTPIEFRLTALPILGYPSVHFSAWPRFTYGLHFPAFPCPPPPLPPRPRLMLLLSIPFRLRFISIHKRYLAAPKSRDITHKPSLLGCLFTRLPVRPSH